MYRMANEGQTVSSLVKTPFVLSCLFPLQFVVQSSAPFLPYCLVISPPRRHAHGIGLAERVTFILSMNL